MSQKTIVILHSFRTGSNLVARILSQNGIGDAREWFNTDYCESLSGSSLVEKKLKLNELISSRSINDIFSIKLPLDHFCNFSYHIGNDGTKIETLPDVFGNVEFIYIEREDVISQSISFWKAKATDQWYVEGSIKPKGEPEYDFKGIYECYNYLCREKFIWNEILKNSQVNVIKLKYEDFQNDSSVIERMISQLWGGIFVGSEFDFEYKIFKQSGTKLTEYKRKFLKDYVRNSVF